MIELLDDPFALLRTCRAFWMVGKHTKIRLIWLVNHSQHRLKEFNTELNSERQLQLVQSVFETGVQYHILTTSVWSQLLFHLNSSLPNIQNLNHESFCLNTWLARWGKYDILVLALTYGFCNANDLLKNLVRFGHVNQTLALLQHPQLFYKKCITLPHKVFRYLAPSNVLCLIDNQSISIQSFVQWGTCPIGQHTLRQVLDGKLGSTSTQSKCADLFREVSEELIVYAIMRKDQRLVSFILSMPKHTCLNLARVQRIAIQGKIAAMANLDEKQTDQHHTLNIT
ncbi:hypothetical protein O5D80_006388 [Batrachochytrium dendrobatidis]|nr:hypothetical protein O5D80_006388 [Batrachochytrium dendrobatidis]